MRAPPEIIFRGSDVQFYPKQVKTKKTSSRPSTSNFPLTSSEDQKKKRKSSRLPTSYVPPKIRFATWYGSPDGALLYVHPPPPRLGDASFGTGPGCNVAVLM